MSLAVPLMRSSLATLGLKVLLQDSLTDLADQPEFRRIFLDLDSAAVSSLTSATDEREIEITIDYQVKTSRGTAKTNYDVIRNVQKRIAR